MENCLPWEGPHGGAGEVSEEEQAAETTCDVLSEVEPGKKGESTESEGWFPSKISIHLTCPGFRYLYFWSDRGIPTATTGGSEAEVSLTGNEWQKHPIVTGPEALCILGTDYLRRGYFKDRKGYWWAFGIAALEMEEIKQLSTLPGLSEDPSVVGLLRVKEQQLPITTTALHRQQYCTNRDSLIPIHRLIR
ncbi:hypothetical protein QYF61_017796 [Mycteria americana]|uniref:Uncharacterized protein n=1 Tax=Mycteria americana TaxID=33587 RepID=A0AAN7PRY7_MYCAM|nr:hypothetical protein QYF61_017796 [Mycteria americana]